MDKRKNHRREGGGSNFDGLVELLGRYSKMVQQLRAIKRLLAASHEDWPEREPAGVIAGRRVLFRLSHQDILQLVDDYAAGSTGRELAERFGIARSTVIQLLKEQGVDVRHPRMSDLDCAQAVELYQRGERQIDIAAQLGRSKSVIWHVLRRAGAL
jgi:transcriptional regulator with XRE-family HTH domain